MPRTIVVAGGGRRVGKTRLAEALAAILGDAAVIKIGVHHGRAGKNPLFFPAGTTLAQAAAAAGEREWLVVESGAALDDPDPDVALAIFLPAPGGDKAGSERRRARAGIVRGVPVGGAARKEIRGRLGVDDAILSAIIAAVEASGSA